MNAIATLATAILGLLEKLLPDLSDTSVIGLVVGALVSLIPLLIQEAQDLLPEAQNIIAILKNNQAVTPAQFQQLEAAEAQIDAAFEAAATAAGDPESPST